MGKLQLVDGANYAGETETVSYHLPVELIELYRDLAEFRLIHDREEKRAARRAGQNPPQARRSASAIVREAMEAYADKVRAELKGGGNSQESSEAVAPSQDKHPLSELPRALIKAGYEPTTYRRAYSAGVDGAIPVTRGNNGRWSFNLDDLPAIADGLVISKKQEPTT